MALNFWSLCLMSSWVMRGGGDRKWSITRLIIGCLLKVSMVLAMVAGLVAGVRLDFHPPSLIVGISTLLVVMLGSLFVHQFEDCGTSV
jgi:hypothetical protein